MTTLVTGATGFVGSHVARQLVAAGDNVRVLVRRSSNLAVLEGLAVEPVEGDLRDGDSLDRAMQGVRRVYHVAADYRLWTPKPAEIYESNVEGTRRFAGGRTTRGSFAHRIYQHCGDHRGAAARRVAERADPGDAG